MPISAGSNPNGNTDNSRHKLGVRPTGIEPVTHRLRVSCSTSELRTQKNMEEGEGLEPPTSGLSVPRSIQLSYPTIICRRTKRNSTKLIIYVKKRKKIASPAGIKRRSYSFAPSKPSVLSPLASLAHSNTEGARQLPLRPTPSFESWREKQYSQDKTRLYCFSIPGRTRTCNLLLRRESLYPVELRGLNFNVPIL